MVLVETSAYCEQHCWVGKPDESCPHCERFRETQSIAENKRWKAMTPEQQLEELRKRIESLESAPRPDGVLF